MWGGERIVFDLALINDPRDARRRWPFHILSGNDGDPPYGMSGAGGPPDI